MLDISEIQNPIVRLEFDSFHPRQRSDKPDAASIVALNSGFEEKETVLPNPSTDHMQADGPVAWRRQPGTHPLGEKAPDEEFGGLRPSQISVSSTRWPEELKRMCTFKQFPRLQMIGNHSDHCSDLHDCLVRLPAIQQFPRERQARIRVCRCQRRPAA